MAWEEWEEIKATAVDRHSTRMQLNQLPADQGAAARVTSALLPAS